MSIRGAITRRQLVARAGLEVKPLLPLRGRTRAFRFALIGDRRRFRPWMGAAGKPV
jgi:hypothetical protein